MPPKKSISSKGATSKKHTVAGKDSKTKVTAKKSTGKETKAKPQVKKWSIHDDAALKIQALIRGFLGRRKYKKKIAEKEKYEEMVEQLEKEAFVQIVKMEQEEAKRKREKEDEEKRRKREMAKRVKRMLEAAFDGDTNEMKIILKEIVELDDKAGVPKDSIGKAIRERHIHSFVECEDANGNTPLSEAASGGHKDAITMLLDKGADPNTRGHFNRTPVYRAAFAGHLEACQVLLQNGADPRLFAEDGQNPEQVAAIPPVKELLETWDIAQTETLLNKLEAEKGRRIEENKKRLQAEASKIENQIKDIEKEYQFAQKRLCCVTEDLNKRIYEHDTYATSGMAKPEVTLQAIHDAEADLEIAKIDSEKARVKLQKAKLALREKRMEEKGDEDVDDGLQCLKVTVKELDDVLFRDVGNVIKNAEKWPLIIDPTGQACTFLRYRDTNYITALSPKDMEPDRIRLALFGAIRFGKPFVIDMMDLDLLEVCERQFDETYRGLLEDVLTKNILKEERYMKLQKKSDGPEYDRVNFLDQKIKNFKVFIITRNSFPSEKLLSVSFPIQVGLPP